MVIRFWICVLLATVLLTGCGDSGPKIVPVEGTVTLDGKPLAYKSLTFVPAEGTAGNGAGGFTNGEGKYSLLAFAFGATKDYNGCPPGQYRVVVTEPTIPISEADFIPLSGDEEEGDESVVAHAPARNPAKRNFPAIYTSSKTTPLLLEVSKTGGVISIELASPPR